MPPAVQDRSGGGHQELGQGGEDRGRLRRLLLQGRRPGNILRLHQQLLAGHGVRQTGKFRSLSFSIF